MDAGESRRTHVSAVAALDEPTRRRLYDYVVRQPAPVSRDEAATALRLPRATVAFHLDRLAGQGLLDVVHQRRTGRSGPGAGRPSKLYHRSERQIAVSLPDRHYDLAGQLLAAAVQEAEHTGQSPRTVLEQRARELGEQLGAAARADNPAQDDWPALLHALETHGYEPRAADRDVVLANCPFHRLAQDHTELVCGMNLRLLTGLLTGLGTSRFTARLDPTPDLCCVRLTPAQSTQERA